MMLTSCFVCLMAHANFVDFRDMQDEDNTDFGDDQTTIMIT